ncbi:MAG: hypothetical protein U0401_02860 [Anaerolineae bacterium]
MLTNVNREITRFAIRPGYLNYAVKANSLPTSTTTVGYDKVLSTPTPHFRLTTS